MNANSLWALDLHLLERLRDPGDGDAWGLFDRRYGPCIRAWCLRWGLQVVDAEDLCQQLLLKLFGKLRTFVYDPDREFLPWLKTLVRHAVCDFLERQSRTVQGSGDDRVAGLLGQVEARQDVAQRLEEQFDLALLETACSRVRRRVAPSTWDALAGTVLEGRSPSEVASRLGMPVDRVYDLKGRGLRLLRQEVRRLQR
jgi:RNA polymerase sigma-70 factor (ECF subfamily)